MSDDISSSDVGMNDVPTSRESASDEATRQARRGLIKTGAILLPAVLTLRATPAWAQTDYTITAYRYGVGKGLCKNPQFNPNANPDSTAGTEFVPCPTGNTSDLSDPSTTYTPGSDDTVHFGR